MYNLQGTVKANERAVVREWRDAIEAGALELAERIAAANPDLFDDEGEPLWHETA